MIHYLITGYMNYLNIFLYFPPQTRYYEYLPTMIFGGMAALSGFLVLTLPETNNLKLPDSLSEAEDQDRRQNNEETAEKTTDIKTRL